MKKFFKTMRDVHIWVTIVVLIPICIMTVSGIVLMLKKQLDWVQPPTQKGVGKEPTVFFSDMLDTVKALPNVEVTSWEDIDRIDVRPSKGVAKVRLQDRTEVQIDIQTGKSLQVMKRNSDLIEDIHTGAFWGDKIKYGYFLVAGIVFFVQLLTGIYLFFRIVLRKIRNRRKA